MPLPSADAQDGNNGSSKHGKHHDGFLSAGRYFTGVLCAANEAHAEWEFERLGRGRTRVVLPDPGRMYLLLFSASANTMATHAVSNLPRTTVSGRLGSAERYSLSFSCGLTDEWRCGGEAASSAELLRLLRERARFEHVHEIQALRPAPGMVRVE